MSVGSLLDTNVLSELMRPSPAHEVMTWFVGQDADQLNTSLITGRKYWRGLPFCQKVNVEMRWQWLPMRFIFKGAAWILTPSHSAIRHTPW